MYHDNKNSILLEENGRVSCSKRTWHINIRYFFLKDIAEKEGVSIVYCPTDHMIADFFTKPLQEKKFANFRDRVLGLSI